MCTQVLCFFIIVSVITPRYRTFWGLHHLRPFYRRHYIILYLYTFNGPLPEEVSPLLVGPVCCCCCNCCAADIPVNTVSANNTATTVVGRRRHCTWLQVYSIISQRPQNIAVLFFFAMLTINHWLRAMAATALNVSLSDNSNIS